MIASLETNAHLQVLIDAGHIVCLVFLGVRVVFAGIKVSELQSPPDSYNARQFTFAYFSLSAWILWVFQYAIQATPFFTLSKDLSLTIGLILGVVQNALWTCAALSLPFKSFSRKSLTLPLLAVVSVVSAVIAIVAYQAAILSSPELNGYVVGVDGLWNAVVFMVVGISIFQLGFGKKSAEAFLTHGYTQWIWRLLLLSPWATTLVVQIVYPAWRVFLFIVWARLISEMAKRTEPPDQKIARVSKQSLSSDNQRPKAPNLLVTLKVMISSTVQDLEPEREAADRAIRGLNLDRFRAEKFGSLPHPPEVICALLAEQCDIFVLIIGERYGYEIESRKISVVEFEYEVACAQDRGKILVYIKDGVTREPRLEAFVRRLEDFERGHFRTLFKTADELPEKIQGDISRLVLLRMSVEKI